MASATSAPRDAGTPQGAVSNEFERMITSTETIADTLMIHATMDTTPHRSPKSMTFASPTHRTVFEYRTFLRRWGD